MSAPGYYGRVPAPLPCLLRPDPTHLAHYWWGTSSGGGHMLDRLGDTDPAAVDWSRERNVTRYRCPGRRPGATLLVRHEADDDVWWLLGKRTAMLDGTWSGFGGSAEPGETRRQTMVREFEEETGLWFHADLSPGRGTLMDWSSSDVGTPDRPHWVGVATATVDVLPSVRLTWETDEVQWVNTAWIDRAADRVDFARSLHPLHPGLANAWAAVPDHLRGATS